MIIKRVLTNIGKFFVKLPSVACYIGIASILIALVLLFLESIIRKTLSISIIVTDEMGGMGLLMFTALAAGYVYQKGRHLRATFIVDRFPRMPAYIVEFLLSILALGLFGGYTYIWWDMAFGNLKRGLVLSITMWPVGPFQMVALAGWVVLFVAIVEGTVSQAREIFRKPPME